MKKNIMTVLLSLILISKNYLSACTGITASRGDTVLFANNEDWSDPDTYVWFVPAKPGKFGGIYLGYGDLYPQGGMNEKGLCFDGFATPFYPVHNPGNKPQYNGNFLYKVMETCQTVEEVVDQFSQYYLPWMSRCQFMFVDNTGASAIIEGDSVIHKGGNFQICTNFYQSNPQVGWYPCWRYNTAKKILENSDSISIDLFRSILDAVHQEGAYPTQYSNIFDLNQKIVYLYYFHDFEHVIKFDLAEELKLGVHVYSIPSLYNTCVKEAPIIPFTFILHQNYPNPFNLQTTIQFDLPHPSVISIKIYNIHGKLVRLLSYGQNLGTGSHCIVWDGKDDKGIIVSSGEYFYRLEIARFVETKKMLLLK